MPDTETTVQQLREIVRQFVSDRDWHRFHSPKNLSMALAIEAAELMEHFQWLTIEDSRAMRGRVDDVSEVGDELADVVCYALAIANELDIDVSDAMREKMKKNEVKYPADQYRGRYGPKDNSPTG